MMEDDKRIHDLAMLYAFVNYMEAKRENPDIFNKEQQRHGPTYETDFIHSLYMEALREYSNCDDDLFDLDTHFEE